jgi:hypothetical protein
MKQLLIILALAFSSAACGDGDCTFETCANGAEYQSCVDGSDLVVLDAAGEEYSRCETDTVLGVSVGDDGNDCALKHAQSKTDLCNQAAASNTGGGTNTVGGRTCWTDPAQSLCNCDVSSEASSTGTEVPECNATVFGQPLRCVQYPGTICGCMPVGCDSGGERCTCGPSSAVVPRTASACTGYEWYCAKDDGSECYGGTGNFGSACGNGEHSVSSCAVTDVQTDNMSGPPPRIWVASSVGTQASRHCEAVAASPSAHQCSVDEIWRLAQMGAGPPVTGWVSGASGSTAPVNQRDCYGWSATGSAANDERGPVWSAAEGVIGQNYCWQGQVPALCCD